MHGREGGLEVGAPRGADPLCIMSLPHALVPDLSYTPVAPAVQSSLSLAPFVWHLSISMPFPVASDSDRLDTEKKERNYFQLERDKINAFWEISRKEVEDRNAELRNYDRATEALNDSHQVELRVYKQKVKHLLYEHQRNAAWLHEAGECALELQLENHREREVANEEEKRSLKLELKDLELLHMHSLCELKKENYERMTKLESKFEHEIKLLHGKYERQMKMLRDNLELGRKVGIVETEERKNRHINELMKKHETAFCEIKSYYNSITNNNLDLIRSLKAKIGEMVKRRSSNEKAMHEIAQKNKTLHELLAGTHKDVITLHAELARYEKNKMAMENMKLRQHTLKAQLRESSWEHQILEQRHHHAEHERNELRAKVEKAIYEVQQKSGLQNVLLECKLGAVSGRLTGEEGAFTIE